MGGGGGGSSGSRRISSATGGLPSRTLASVFSGRTPWGDGFLLLSEIGGRRGSRRGLVGVLPKTDSEGPYWNLTRPGVCASFWRDGRGRTVGPGRICGTGCVLSRTVREVPVGGEGSSRWSWSWTSGVSWGLSHKDYSGEGSFVGDQLGSRPGVKGPWSDRRRRAEGSCGDWPVSPRRSRHTPSAGRKRGADLPTRDGSLTPGS